METDTPARSITVRPAEGFLSRFGLYKIAGWLSSGPGDFNGLIGERTLVTAPLTLSHDRQMVEMPEPFPVARLFVSELMPRFLGMYTPDPLNPWEPRESGRPVAEYSRPPIVHIAPAPGDPGRLDMIVELNDRLAPFHGPNSTDARQAAKGMEDGRHAIYAGTFEAHSSACTDSVTLLRGLGVAVRKPRRILSR